ncbi:proteasome endopeptidase complex [Malassezia nana]|uniref:Proteasome endopeptidase complex n=1 Tax=Malassezia nana TaxID=180528 RepID=A0AAF0EQB6_9BASI|nr:proteasome endopeptidase complex [Malassezia nana]
MPVGHQFSPYTSNGGSILAIHGEDYCVIAGDTRQSEGYNIQTRYKPKVFRFKRFFPYYVYNILGGIDEEGRGAVYSYDPVGSYERIVCSASGTAQGLMQPFLDNQVMFKNLNSTDGSPLPEPGHLPLNKTLRIVMDSFTSATERHIEVGDGLEIYVVRAIQSTEENAPSMGTRAIDVPLADLGAVEALGGEDAYTPGACMVIRRELKKD